jgi:hypothetical protein
MIRLKQGKHGAIDPRKVVQQNHHGGTTMLERTLPIPQIALGENFRTRRQTNAREFVQGLWDRIKQLMCALVDFFASSGPLS